MTPAVSGGPAAGQLSVQAEIRSAAGAPKEAQMTKVKRLFTEQGQSLKLDNLSRLVQG